MSIRRDEGQHEGSQEGGVMGMLAGIPAGKRTKWLVLGLWLALIAAASPFAARLAGLEENNQAAWLPAGAESLAVSELQEQFRGN
jgi:putative drug exporter of the RND superfamily